MLILLFQAQIIPDQVFRFVEAVALQVVFLHLQGGQMIAIENQHGGLASLLQHLNQLADKGVHFVDLIGVIFDGIALVLVCNGGDLDFRVFQHRVAGIFAMALDRDGKDKIRRVGGIQSGLNFVGQHVVFAPAFGRFCEMRNVF